MAKKQAQDPKPKPDRQPKPDRPHAGVDRRKRDMSGRKYSGTTWTKY